MLCEVHLYNEYSVFYNVYVQVELQDSHKGALCVWKRGSSWWRGDGCPGTKCSSCCSPGYGKEALSLKAELIRASNITKLAFVLNHEKKRPIFGVEEKIVRSEFIERCTLSMKCACLCTQQ